ncbi:MAG: tetratricopeptide repeat protein, partial [Burkholderiales bacterium]
MPPSAATTESFAAAFGDATKLHKAGKVAEATAQYEQLRQSAPDDPQLLYLLGGAYLQLGRAREAIPVLERSLALRPGFRPALDVAGSAWVAAGEPVRALPYLREAASADATLDTVTRLATALLRCDLPGEALAQYDRCLTLGPDDAGALTGRGTALTHLNRLDEAAETLRRCVAIHPRYGKGHVALGIVLGQQERFADAEAHFRTAVELAPAKAESWHWLAISLQKQGRAADAVEAYTRARTLNPASDAIAIELAEALIDLHRLDDARDVLAQTESANTSSSALTASGRIEERRGNLASAIELHARAIAANPRNEAAYINRGSARRFAGDYDGAIS